MRITLIFVLMFFAVLVDADAIQSVELRHRDAAALEHSLQLLVKKDLTIVRDGNTLLLRGAPADVNAIIKLVKKLDQPGQTLQLEVYRGVDPHIRTEKKVKTASTQLNKNQRNRILTQEGETVVVAETALFSLPVLKFWRGKQEAGELKQPSDLELESYTLEEQQQKEAGIFITPVLIGDKQVSVEAVFSQFYSEHIDQPQPVAIKHETKLTLPLGQWTKVSQLETVSVRPSLDKKSRVFSTQAKGDYYNSVWLKVTKY